MASSDSGSTAMVELTIHKALTLVGLNPGGTSNPYVTATIGTQSVSTPVASKTVNPCYDCSFTFAQCQLPAILTLRVFNKLPYVEMEDAMGMATVTLFGPCDAQTRTVQLTHGGVAALAQRAPAGCGTLHITYCVTATPPSPTQRTQAQQETQQQQAQQQQAQQQQQQQPAAPLIVPPANSMVGGPLAMPLQLPAATTTTQQQPSSQQQQQQSNGALLYASSPSMTAAPTAARSPNLTTSATAAAGSVYARQHAEQSSSSSSDGDTPAAATAAAAVTGNSDAAHVAAADRQVGVCTPPSLVPPRVSPVPVLTQPGNLIAAQATTAPTATTSDKALVLNPTGLSTYVSYPVPGATPQPTAGGRGHGNGSSNNSSTSSSSNSDNKGGSAMAARTLQHSSEMFYANNDVPAAQLPPPSLPPSLGGVTAEGGRTDNTDGSAAATALSLSPLPRTHEMAMLPVATVMSPKQQQQQQHSASSSANALTVPSPHDEAAAATLSRSVDAAPPAAAATSLREPYPPASRAPSLLQAPLLTPPSLQQQQQPEQPHEDERATAMHVARAPATPPLSSAASSARTTPSTLHYGSTQGGAAAVLPSQPVHGYRSNNNHTAATRQPGRGVHMVPSADGAAHSLPRQRGGRDVLPLVADDATAATTAAAVLRRTGAPQPVTAGLTSSSSSLPSAQQRHHDAAVTAATTTSAAVALYADRVYLFEAAATGRDIAIFHELRRVDPRLTGGFVHCVDYAGATLLHCAAWHGQLAVMQVLLSAQPVAPALDVRGLVARTSGNTLLHAAACGGQAAVVQWLLYTHPTAGPLLLPLRNLRGMTAADCAKEAGFDALAQQLLSAAAAAAAAAAASSTMMRRV